MKSVNRKTFFRFTLLFILPESTVGAMAAATFVLALIFLSLSILLSPLGLLLLLGNEFIRIFINLILRYKYSGNIQLVSDGNDAVYRPNRSMVISLIRIENPIAPEESMEKFTKDVLLLKNPKTREHQSTTYAKLEQILIDKFGYRCWKKDENFNIKNHCRTVVSNSVVYKTDLLQLIRKLADDMEEDKPQWEIVLIPNYQEAGEVVTSSLIVFRFHHAYMDALSFTMMIEKLTSNYNYYIDPCKTLTKKTFKEQVVNFIKFLYFGPLLFILLTTNRLRSFWPKIPQKCSKTLRNYTWSKPIKLDQIREIRKSLKNASIPVIIDNAFISSTMQVLPRHRYPETWSLGELSALLPYKNSGPQNRFSIFSYEINVTQENELERIQTTANEAAKEMTLPWILIGFLGLKIFGRFPKVVAQLPLFGTSNTLIMSYFPCSKTKFKLFQSVNVLDIWGFPPHGNNTGIFLCCNMYCNEFKVLASSDSDWLEEKELKEIVNRIPEIISKWVYQLNKKND
ncbi:unnamed protein product [Orchesella dallaii]|uniref:O-acyltransferase WSD1-like N-terminal domain-containing protein n=1 Tax=Orchesella dallaii TaxID=48710 RepID=A0ABP1Q3C5_9HEXA